MPEAASIQIVTAPSTIHAGCTRRIELTGLGYGLAAGRFSGRKDATTGQGAWRVAPDALPGRSNGLPSVSDRRGPRREGDRVTLRVDHDGVTVVDLALEQL